MEGKVNYITYRTITYFPRKLMYSENANKLNRFSLTIDIIIAANATEEIEDECFRGPAKQLKDLVEDPLVRCYINLLMI